MPTPLTNNTPTEADVTSQNYPGTGVPTGQQQAVDDRAAVGTDGNSYSANTIPPDFDFDIQADTDQRPAGNTHDMSQAFGNAPAPGGQTPIDKLVVNFKGQQREYDVNAATTMLQQYLNMQEVSPVVGRVRTMAAAMGITDPNQMAQMVEQALANHIQGGQQPQPAAPGPADIRVPDQQPANPITDALSQAQQVDAEAIVDRWFNDNGIVPTDEMRAVFVNNVRYGRLIEQVGTVLPTLMNDVNEFKQEKAREIADARANNVASVADRVANELGIDTPEEAQAFMSWVDQQEQFIPNYKSMIGQNPAAMENAIRTFASINMGQRAVAERDTLKQTVQTNLSRAGGDGVASRGPAGIPGNAQAPKDFNKQMLDMI